MSCALPALAQKSGTMSISDWSTYYYLDKTPDKVGEFLGWLTKSKGTLDDNAAETLKGFLAEIFAQNPPRVGEWTNASTFNYSGKLREIIDYAQKPPVALQDQKIKTAADIERIWGAFFASGDDLYLKKIVDVLDPSYPLEGGEDAAKAMRNTAALSLGSAMTRHEAVERFLVHESEARTGKTADELKQIVSNVRKQREAHAFPNKDGEFSAILFISDPQIIKQQLSQASRDEVIHIKEMDQVKKDDTRTVVIIFAGQQLSADYKANVTYDLQLTDPDGKIYTDLKDLEGIKSKVPTRFRTFYNLAAPFIHFDKKDTPGVYKVKVTLKDNIGHKSILIEAQITLKKTGHPHKVNLNTEATSPPFISPQQSLDR